MIIVASGNIGSPADKCAMTSRAIADCRLSARRRNLCILDARWTGGAVYADHEFSSSPESDSWRGPVCAGMRNGMAGPPAEEGELAERVPSTSASIVTRVQPDAPI